MMGLIVLSTFTTFSYNLTLQVVVSLSAMSKIISFDKVEHLLLGRHIGYEFPSSVSGILVCEAGYILENIISFLDSEGKLGTISKAP
ncbi:hypothetical protein Ahy_A10g048634 isoform F [Arachis hypogaea]|uniref:Uncharacterized protein n=1 Tax=Arachis hypogaea TaxID=3818 RepID=A0A445B5I6_ARAHY|nr:hypothetical protein Ahy_A10g048634 isoform F [Arachis hypogaea]